MAKLAQKKKKTMATSRKAPTATAAAAQGAPNAQSTLCNSVLSQQRHTFSRTLIPLNRLIHSERLLTTSAIAHSHTQTHCMQARKEDGLKRKRRKLNELAAAAAETLHRSVEILINNSNTHFHLSVPISTHTHIIFFFFFFSVL